MAATLRDLAAACGADRRGAVCRELTKIHEQVVRGSLGELAAAAADGTIPARGEFVLVVGMGEADTAPGAAVEAQDALADARAEVDRLVATGVARGEAAKQVAAERRHPASPALRRRRRRREQDREGGAGRWVGWLDDGARGLRSYPWIRSAGPGPALDVRPHRADRHAGR